MSGLYFTFRGVTAAQRGQKILSSAGIPATLSRTPTAIAVNGCGYCLRLSSQWAGEAAGLLRGSGLQRCYLRSGIGFSEVDCDLL